LKLGLASVFTFLASCEMILKHSVWEQARDKSKQDQGVRKSRAFDALLSPVCISEKNKVD
jgi:hypothetical protein